MVGFTMEDMEVDINKSATINFATTEKVLMVMGEVDIGLRPAPHPHTIQERLVDHWVFIVIVMTEVDIGLRPSNFIRIKMVNYTFTTQGFLKRIFQGVYKEKINIKKSLLFLFKNSNKP